MARTRKIQRHKRNETRSSSRPSSELMTLESLHAAFEKIEDRIRNEIAAGCTDEELSDGIQSAWITQFHREPDHSALIGLVHHYRATSPRVTRKAGGSKGKGKGRGKGRGKKEKGSQRGGMAPLDWSMGPGSSTVPMRAPVFGGGDPQYIGALDNQRFNENPASRSFDTTGGFDAPGQVGGSIWSTLTQGHPLSSVPANTLQSAVTVLQGGPQGPSASAVTGVVPVGQTVLSPFNPQPIHTIGDLSTVYKGY